jgi:hypothetical protein
LVAERAAVIGERLEIFALGVEEDGGAAPEIAVGKDEARTLAPSTMPCFDVRPCFAASISVPKRAAP